MPRKNVKLYMGKPEKDFCNGERNGMESSWGRNQRKRGRTGKFFNRQKPEGYGPADPEQPTSLDPQLGSRKKANARNRGKGGGGEPQTEHQKQPE